MAPAGPRSTGAVPASELSHSKHSTDSIFSGESSIVSDPIDIKLIQSLHMGVSSLHQQQSQSQQPQPQISRSFQNDAQGAAVEPIVGANDAQGDSVKEHPLEQSKVSSGAGSTAHTLGTSSDTSTNELHRANSLDMDLVVQSKPHGAVAQQQVQAHPQQPQQSQQSMQAQAQTQTQTNMEMSRTGDGEFHNETSYYCVGRDFYDDGYNEQDDIVSVEDTIDFKKLRFHGRQKELRVMQMTYDRLMSYWKITKSPDGAPPSPTKPGKTKSKRSSANKPPLPPNACIIRGVSGCGKSSLVSRFAAMQTATKPYVLRGKFDQSNVANPLSAFGEAFSGLVSYFDGAGKRPSVSSHNSKAAAAAATDAEQRDAELNRIRLFLHDHFGQDSRQIRQYLRMLNPALEQLFGNIPQQLLQKHQLKKQAKSLEKARKISASAGEPPTGRLKRRSMILGGMKRGSRRSSVINRQSEVSVEILRALASTSQSLKMDDEASSATGAGHSHLPQHEQQKPFHSGHGRSHHSDRGTSIAGNAWNQMKYTILSVCKAVATKDRPLVVHIDDLQWADNDSLNLFSSLLLDTELQFCFFIGSFRSDEVDYNPAHAHEERCGFGHPLSKSLHELSKTRPFKMIDLKNLTLQQTKQFLAICLKLDEGSQGSDSYEDIFGSDDDDDGMNIDRSGSQSPANDLLGLSKVIHDKTHGNIFFTLQMLEELIRNNVVYFSRMMFCWEWNLENVDLDAVLSDNIIEAIVSKIQNISNKTLQSVLKVASYTNTSTIHMDILHHLLGMDGISLTEDELREVLDEAIEQGLLQNALGSMEYRFVHDRIQQASASLVPEGKERETFRYHMGHRLLKLARTKSTLKLTPEERSWMWYAAVDHFNATHETMHHDPVFIARLNLQVAEKAVDMAAFDTASDYLQMSLAMLLRLNDPWKNYYVLSLRLYRMVANVEFYQGHFEIGYGIAERVLMNAKTTADKLPTYIALAVALGQEEEHEEAIELNRDVLWMLDAYPKRFYAPRIINHLLFLKQYMARKSNAKVMQLPCSDDSKLEQKLALLNELSSQAVFCDNVPEFQLSMLKMVRLTLEHGHSSYSAIAFVKYGMYLSNSGNQIGAKRMVKLAQNIYQRYPSQNGQSIASFIMAHWIDPWTQSHEATLQMYQHGQRVGMQVGEMNNAFLNAYSAWHHAYLCGYSLQQLEMTGHRLQEKMRIDGDGSTGARLNQSMIGVNALVLGTGETIDWDELSTLQAQHQGNSEQYRLLFGFITRCQLGVYFGNFRFASDMARRMWRVLPRDTAYVVVTLRCFFAGLAASGRARQTGMRGYIQVARKWMNQLIAANRSKDHTDTHRELIMEADLKSAIGARESVVRDSFDLAIKASLEVGHLQDAALASELLAEYYIKSIDEANTGCVSCCCCCCGASSQSKNKTTQELTLMAAKYHMTNAHGMYAEWGAKAKVKHLSKTRSDYLDCVSTDWKSVSATTSEFNVRRGGNAATSTTDGQSVSGRGSLDVDDIVMELNSSHNRSAHEHRPRLPSIGPPAGSSQPKPTSSRSIRRVASLDRLHELAGGRSLSRSRHGEATNTDTSSIGV